MTWRQFGREGSGLGASVPSLLQVARPIMEMILGLALC